jgi:hypothetical protein
MGSRGFSGWVNHVSQLQHIVSDRADPQQASLAQLVERGTSNAEVTGSTPLGGMSFCSFLHYLEGLT